MKRLYDVCVAPKIWRSFPKGSHNDTYAESGYFDGVLEFITAVLRDDISRVASADFHQISEKEEEERARA